MDEITREELILENKTLKKEIETLKEEVCRKTKAFESAYQSKKAIEARLLDYRDSIISISTLV